MRFKRQFDSSPEVNLIPMMDVLMSVLTFFIITSITLTGQRLGDIVLPEGGGGADQEVDAFTVGLTKEGEILMAGQTIGEEELVQQMQSYLSEYPEGTVIVKADRELVYQDVLSLLEKMAEIGGERVSLAIEE
ncbi:MAG: ExbD/TolR family protein [Cyanophyceae cyanobacterium]